jgi:ppGpp synthetase/RelA/SpoT-type nucleotidyltranferase
LGDRLRRGDADEKDLRLLDEYRQSFSDAYQQVVAAVRELGVNPTGRPSKTTGSIQDKLRRESIRLSQIQDIAGCRVIVANLIEQDDIVSRLTVAFEKTVVFDRRTKPSHDYRAVHVVVHTNGKPIEVQIRTPLQHAWAEVSEKLSDVEDPTIKYGGGSNELRGLLERVSMLTAKLEKSERTVMDFSKSLGPKDRDIEDGLNESRRLLTEILETFVEEWRSGGR